MTHLLPTPQKIEWTDSVCRLDNLSIVLAPGQDIRLYRAALRVKDQLAALLGRSPKVCTALPEFPCIAIETEGKTGEGYTLTVAKTGIRIVGEGPAGTFYGIQTLRQLLQSCQNCVLKGVEITDRPALAIRGIYHDVTRGKVPTLDTLKQLVDRLASYKINMLQLYIEDAFEFDELQGIMQPHEVMTADEIRQLDDYCYDQFMELTPSISTFGHLYRLLQSPKYQHLCEYENYQPTLHPWHEKMQHHTIDPYNPQSIQVIHSMIDQFVGLCCSRYFNICCDETFDLCKGRNAGKDVGEAYFGFVKQIIERVKFHGKQPMMWGDIVLQHPDKVGELADVIMLNWDYGPCPTPNNTEAFAKAGVEQIVCPGTASWNRWLEGLDGAKGNISRMAEYAMTYGAKGILTTNWGDFGNVCSITGALYGLALGAQKGWNPTAPDGEEYEQAFSFLAYGQRVNMADCLRCLAQCENAASWGALIGFLGQRDYAGNPVALGADVQRLTCSLEQCRTLQREIADLPTNQQMEDLLLISRAIELMIQLFLYLENAGEKPDVEPFLAEHRAAWLRENKQSQLTWVEHTLRSI